METAIDAALASQADRQASSDPVERFTELLADGLSSGQIHVCDYGTGDYPGGGWGWERHGEGAAAWGVPPPGSFMSTRRRERLNYHALRFRQVLVAELQHGAPGNVYQRNEHVSQPEKRLIYQPVVVGVMRGAGLYVGQPTQVLLPA